MIRQGGKPIQTVWVHCAATRPEWLEGRLASEKVAEIKRWHLARGWNDIGYHWVIDRDGTIVAGRKEHVVGAHVQNHNSGSIGVCLIGGHGAGKGDAFLEHFTEEQDAALRGLLAQIEARTGAKRVRGHCEVANKACPGFDVSAWRAGKAPAAPSLTSSTTIKNAATGIAATGAVAAEHGAGAVSETIGAVRDAWGPGTTIGTLAEAAKGDAKWLLIFVLVAVLGGVIISRVRAQKEGKIG